MQCLQIALNKGLYDVAETLVSIDTDIKSHDYHQIYD
jgi:hypothetical protein